MNQFVVAQLQEFRPNLAILGNYPRITRCYWFHDGMIHGYWTVKRSQQCGDHTLLDMGPTLHVEHGYPKPFNRPVIGVEVVGSEALEEPRFTDEELKLLLNDFLVGDRIAYATDPPNKHNEIKESTLKKLKTMFEQRGLADFYACWGPKHA